VEGIRNRPWINDCRTYTVEYTGERIERKPSRNLHPKADGTTTTLGHGSPGGQDRPVRSGHSLNQIYEEDFLGSPTGSAPGEASIKRWMPLWVGLIRKKVNWVLDATFVTSSDQFRTNGWANSSSTESPTEEYSA